MHPRADAGFVEQTHRALFDDAGANTAEHVFGGLPFQDNVVDAMLVQELTEQKPGRSGADNGDLGSHEIGLPRCRPFFNAAGIYSSFTTISPPPARAGRGDKAMAPLPLAGQVQQFDKIRNISLQAIQ